MKTIVILFLFVVLIPTLIKPIFAADMDNVAQPFLIEDKLLTDKRVEQLRVYLAMKRSPLQNFSHILINIADTYEIPWNLIPAISGVESNFCKILPKGSYNCWGWNNGNYFFNDFESAIDTVGRTLRYKYFKYVLTTPEKINRKYASSDIWAKNVRFFMIRIENFKIGSNDPIDELSLTI